MSAVALRARLGQIVDQVSRRGTRVIILHRRKPAFALATGRGITIVTGRTPMAALVKAARRSTSACHDLHAGQGMQVAFAAVLPPAKYLAQRHAPEAGFDQHEEAVGDQTDGNDPEQPGAEGLLGQRVQCVADPASLLGV